MAEASKKINVSKTNTSDFGMGALDPLRAVDGDMATADNVRISAEHRLQAMKDKALMTQQMGGAPQNDMEAVMGKGDPGAVHTAHAAVAASKQNKNMAARKHYEELYKKGEQGVDETIEEVKGQLLGSIKKTADPKFSSNPMLTEEMANSVIPNKDLYRDRDGRLQVTKYYHDLVANTESFLQAVKQQGIDNLFGEIVQQNYEATDPQAAAAAKASNPMAPPAMEAPQSMAPQGQPTPQEQQAPAPQAAPQAAPAEEETPEALIEYKIQKGDSMSKIATRMGTTVEDIMKANPKQKDAASIVVGKTLLIPPTQEARDVDDVINGGASVSGSTSSSTTTRKPVASTDPTVNARNEDVVKQEFALKQILETDGQDRGKVAQYIAMGGDVDKLAKALKINRPYSIDDKTNQAAELTKQSNASRDRATAAYRQETKDIQRNQAIEKTEQNIGSKSEKTLSGKKKLAQYNAGLTKMKQGLSGAKTGKYKDKAVMEAWERLALKGVNAKNYTDAKYSSDPDVIYIKSAVQALDAEIGAAASMAAAEIANLINLDASLAQSVEVKSALSNKEIADVVQLPKEDPAPVKKKKTAKDFM